jgi:hypothetical protein
LDFVESGGGTTLDPDIVDALEGANLPDAANPFATMDDIPIVAEDFIDLGDTPSSYTGQGTKVVSVKADESGLEFTPAGGGGGADTNAVHYNAADGKTASEKQQARDNIGSSAGIPQIVSDVGSGFLQPLNRTSNFIVFTDPDPPVIALRYMTVDQDGAEVCIWNRSTKAIGCETSAFTAGAFETFVSIAVGNFAIFRYSTAIERWVNIEVKTFLRKDIADIHDGRFTNRGQLFIEGVQPAGEFLPNPIVLIDQSNNAQLFMQGRNSSDVAVWWIEGTGLARFPNMRITDRRLAIGGIVDFNAYCLGIRNWNVNAAIWRMENTAGTVVSFMYDNGTIMHTRSSASDRSIRRDEQLLLYPITVTNAGTVHDLAETLGNFNYYLNACTEITGMAAGENGKSRVIQNHNTVDMVARHENTGSIAANRYDIIGGLDLTIPPGGIVEWTYLSTISRWRLKSKNF